MKSGCYKVAEQWWGDADMKVGWLWELCNLLYVFCFFFLVLSFISSVLCGVRCKTYSVNWYSIIESAFSFTVKPVSDSPGKSNDLSAFNQWLSHIHNRFTALLSLSWATRVSWYQKTHSPTHTRCGHQSSLICFLHLLWSMASFLFNLPARVFFHNLSPSFLWSTSWLSKFHFMLHTFLYAIIVFFSQHMPMPSQSILLYYRDYVI